MRSSTFAKLGNDERRRAIRDLAANEGLSPAFWEAANLFQNYFSKSERISLAIVHEANRRRNNQIQSAICEIAHEAEAQSIPIAVLKGARWIFDSTNESSAWAMIDFDLLVDPGHVDFTRELLERLGYRATRRERGILGGRRFEGHYHIVAMRGSKDLLTIELHRHSGWRPELLSNQKIFQSAQRITSNLYLPSASCAAFHAAIHWQVHHYGYQLGLLKIREGLEMCKFLARTDVDWADVQAMARATGVAREVDAAIATASEIFGMELPSPIDLSKAGREYVQTTLRMKQSLLLTWKARQKQRILRLWRDDRFVYRMKIRQKNSCGN